MATPNQLVNPQTPMGFYLANCASTAFTSVTTPTFYFGIGGTGGTGGNLVPTGTYYSAPYANKSVVLDYGDVAKIRLPNGDIIEVDSDGNVVHSVCGKLNFPLTAKNGAEILLPNGARVLVDQLGSITVLDDNAKVLYKPPDTREFNPYLNSSDLLEEFISYCASVGITKKEF